ncbi:type IV pili twitching motility protein PilT [candidate division WOR-3 bacterium RBG_13_43_14]|uniref:Type IV pili twitching motility protein PilT n=1 Tax=candidate division WOR-3 bacterium RBG_13_43_14 TaxID=1802590 RepID=A0A1F4U358_UNCW3|nr:MAG: type IV pili twitching motility protein PilT [candidate division WOR-3 bacterium RBG_13_43_14]
MTKADLDVLLEELVLREGSDLHLRFGEPPMMRVTGSLQKMETSPLDDNNLKELIYGLMNGQQQAQFEAEHEFDMAYEISGVARFRVNVFRQMRHIAAVMRIIPLKIKSLEEWGFPAVFKKIALLPRGLVLVTGPTGSGKSTTLASIIEHINQTQRKHIITIEDPIEFLHRDKNSIIEQRENGIDTHSYSEALRRIIRQNPDIILVGEMRDLDTIAQTITAAETGHLVFSTLHTIDAVQTIDRIIDVFPPAQQQQIRLQLSTTLQAVITETLLRRKDGPGRVAAFEIMVCTPAIRSAIREAKTPQVYTSIQTGSRMGMIQMDQYLRNLLNQGIIEYEEALTHCTNPDEFEKRAHT